LHRRRRRRHHRHLQPLDIAVSPLISYNPDTRARVAELVDALASGASVRKDVEVQVLSRVPKRAGLLGGLFLCDLEYLLKRRPLGRFFDLCAFAALPHERQPADSIIFAIEIADLSFAS